MQMNGLAEAWYTQNVMFFGLLLKYLLGGRKLDFLTSNSMMLTQKSLDFLWQKQKVTLDNLANVSTPGFKAKYVTFEEQLHTRLSAMKDRTNRSIRNEILDAKVGVHLTNDESTRMDGNNVNADVESMELARTGLQYEYALRSINDDFTRLRTVIRGQ